MSKRNISYVKPQEPNFLRKLKEQIGYKEGPTVETKREILSPVEDDEDIAEEQPTVVVLQPGDLTAEEAANVKEQQDKEKSEAPADLNARIIFKVPEKSVENSKGKKRSSSESLKISKEKRSKSKSLLSFDDEEDDE